MIDKILEEWIGEEEKDEEEYASDIVDEILSLKSLE